MSGTAQDLIKNLDDIVEGFVSGSPLILCGMFAKQTDRVKGMLEEDLGRIVFQESVSISRVSGAIADLLDVYGPTPAIEMIEIVIEKAPMTTWLATTILRCYPELTSKVSSALLNAPYELAGNMDAGRYELPLEVIEKLAQYKHGRAGEVLTQMLTHMIRSLHADSVYWLLKCVGQLPDGEVSLELSSALMEHEKSVLEKINEMAGRGRTFATPPLILGAWRMGSKELVEVMMIPSLFEDTELYEMGPMITASQLVFNVNHVSAFLRTPGDPNLFMLTLFAGNKNLDFSVVTTLYRQAWDGKGPNGGDESVKHPKRAFLQLVKAYKLLLALDLLDEDRMAAVLDDLVSALKAQNPNHDQAFYEDLLFPIIRSDIMLKTQYGLARADRILEIDLGL
jgi:hypothetical protein